MTVWSLVFAELAGCWPQWSEALEGWNVEVSQQVLAWEAQGRAKGKADAVLRFLECRLGGTTPPDLAATIRATRDEALLDRWIDVASAAVSLDDFRALAGL